MSETAPNNQTKSEAPPAMCKNCHNFFANKDFDFLCSGCYKKMHPEAQIGPTTTKPQPPEVKKPDEEEKKEEEPEKPKQVRLCKVTEYRRTKANAGTAKRRWAY